MCMIDYGETCDVFATIKRKSRKDYICAECGRQINKGEIYEYSSFLYEGLWTSVKCCDHCSHAREWLQKHCGGWLTEGLLIDLEEHFLEGYKVDGLGRLIVGIKRRWKNFSDGLLPLPRLAA